MPFLEDSFTGASGTALESHVGEIGATWAEHPSFTSGQYAIDANNRARCQTATGCYYASGVPASADYSVEVLVVVQTLTRRCGFAGRMNTSADTFYYVFWVPGEEKIRLNKHVAGVVSNIGIATLKGTVGVNVTLKLQMSGTTLKVFADGVEKISGTDSSISAAGRAGVFSIENQSAGVGPVFESISASDAVEEVKLPSLASGAQSSASLGTTAPTQVPTAASGGQGAAALGISAATAIPLTVSSAQGAATLGLTAATKAALGTSSALSAATLGKLTFPKEVGLQSSHGEAGPEGDPLLLSEELLLGPGVLLGSRNTFLRLFTPTQVTLQAAAAEGGGTLGDVVVEVALPTMSSDAQSDASLGQIVVAAQIIPAPSAGQTSAALGITAATAPGLSPSLGLTEATLSLSAATQVGLLPSDARGAASLAVTGTGAVLLEPSEATGDGSLGISAETQLSAMASSAATEAFLTLSHPVGLILDHSRAESSASLGLSAEAQFGALRSDAVSGGLLRGPVFRGMELIDEGRDPLVDRGRVGAAHRGRIGDPAWVT